MDYRRRLLRGTLGFKIGLQYYHRGEFVLVTGPFFAGDTEFDAGGAGDLRAVGFIPQFDGDVGLVAEFIGEATRAPACGIWVAVFVVGLTDDDQADFVLRGDIRNLCGIDHARNVFDDFQWASDGGGWVAEGKPDALFAVVNCKDSHGMVG